MAALGAVRYARDAARGGYRNGHRSRTVTGPTGPLALTMPRGTLFAASGTREWTSTLVPRYQRRLRARTVPRRVSGHTCARRGVPDRQ